MKLNNIDVSPYLNLMPDESFSIFLAKTFGIIKGRHNRVRIDFTHEEHLEALIGVKSTIRSVVKCGIDWDIYLPYVPGAFRGHDAVMSYLKALCDTEADEKLRLHTIDCIRPNEMMHINTTHMNVTFDDMSLMQWSSGCLGDSYYLPKEYLSKMKLLSGIEIAMDSNKPTLLPFYSFDVERLARELDKYPPGIVVNPHMTDKMRMLCMMSGWKTLTTNTFNNGSNSISVEDLW